MAMAAGGATAATVEATMADAGSPVDEATRVVQRVASTVVLRFAAAVGSTVAAASMAEVDSTVVVADTVAADTGNPGWRILE